VSRRHHRKNKGISPPHASIRKRRGAESYRAFIRQKTWHLSGGRKGKSLCVGSDGGGFERVQAAARSEKSLTGNVGKTCPKRTDVWKKKEGRADSSAAPEKKPAILCDWRGRASETLSLRTESS